VIITNDMHSLGVRSTCNGMKRYLWMWNSIAIKRAVHIFIAIIVSINKKESKRFTFLARSEFLVIIITQSFFRRSFIFSKDIFFTFGFGTVWVGAWGLGKLLQSLEELFSWRRARPIASFKEVGQNDLTFFLMSSLRPLIKIHVRNLSGRPSIR